RAHLHARARGNAGWASGIGERGVGYADCAGGVAVTRLEHDHLVDRHVGEVVPTVPGVVHVAHRVVDDVALELLGDRGDRHLVGWAHRPCVAQRQREVLRWWRDRTPDVVHRP